MIRRMELADADAMRGIYNHYVRNTTVTFDLNPMTREEMETKVAAILSWPYDAWVYEEDGRVLGFCYAHPWKEKAAYQTTLETTVYLAPDSTGRGIGRLLMERLITSCRESGVHVLIACITSPNPASEALHEKLGFQRVSLFREVGNKFGKWLDVTDFQLIL